MSGSLNNIYNNVNFALHLHSNAISILQEQTSTGSRINRVSDDPTDAYRVLGLNSQKSSLANYMSTIADVMNMQETASTVLDDMSTTFAGTKVSLTQILSGTYGEGEGGANSRERVSSQINDILEQMVSSANTKYANHYLFGGSNTSSAPYVIERTDGQISSVTYQGGSQSREIEMAPGVKSAAFYSGSDIFAVDDRGTPVFFGGTGSAVGTGTSNIKGSAWLTVTNDGTNYKLSIDDGATEITVPLAGDISNIAVTDANGQVLYVDATNINSTGTEMVQVPGTYDVFSSLISIRDLLENDRDIPEADLKSLMDKLTESLDEVNNNLLQKQVSIGAKIGFLDNLKNNLENIKFDTEEEATVLQEADIAQIAIDLSRREALYQLSLETAGRLMSVSLLDFI
jgi:flagellar hook-associated protein 3 FlgL